MRPDLTAARYLPLLTAILLSAGLHALLFISWPDQKTPPSTPAVINAELRQPQPQQAQLQTAPPSAPASQAQAATPAPADQRAASQSDGQASASTASASAAQQQPPAASQPQTAGTAEGRADLSSDPLERDYQQRLLAHLREHMSAPATLNGSVRLSLTFRYRQVVTDVQVIRSSGNAALDAWAVRAAIAANPYPPVPASLPAGYVFRPTIVTEHSVP